MKREQTTKPHELIPIVVCFPAGIKTYIEDPAAILDLPLPPCARCSANQGRWAVHERCPRYISVGGQWLRTEVFRVRCPICRATARLLPDEIIPWAQYSVSTIQTACETYLETAASYRQAALAIAARAVPEHERLSTCWGSPETPSLTPSTIFRWLDRFARGAGAWWLTLAAEAQDRATIALRPQASPGQLPAKARSAAKATALETAWHLLELLRWLLALLDLAPRRWPLLLVFAPRKPRSIDHTGWFVSARAGDKQVPP